MAIAMDGPRSGTPPVETARRQVSRVPTADELRGLLDIWGRPGHGVEMETVHDPETDQALRAFVCWAQSQRCASPTAACPSPQTT